MCEALKQQLATAVAAREEAERERDEALLTVKALTPAANYCLEYKPLLLAAEARAAEAEADVARLERLHAACDATIRELTSRALAAVRGQEAAEARAERLATLLREAHPLIVHAANLMQGEMARRAAGTLANDIRAAIAEEGK